MFSRSVYRNINFHFYKFSTLSRFTVKDALNLKPVGTKILVQGWVQAVRKHKNLYFVDLVDRTCLQSLQVVLESDVKKYPKYGSSIKVEGLLIKSSHKGQEVELTAEKWSTYGKCPDDYPFEYRIKYTPEYVRRFPHLRARTRKISSIFRVRSEASFAVQQFFKEEGFLCIHTPIITQNDCEGAGEVFSVQLKDKTSYEHEPANKSDSDSESEKIIEHEKVPENDKINYPKEFFGVPTYLTVSSQLHLEAMTGAFPSVYNFGPVFRAESSRTRQHASEFYMIEAEMAFVNTIEELTKVVEKCIKYTAQSVLNSCGPEVKFLNENGSQEKYLKKIISEPFVVMSYNDAINVLENCKDKLKVPIKWGDDLATHHKYFLVKHCSDTPVFITMFPSSIKPFYMKKNDNKKEAFCFDLLAPFGGEICGGSLRENDEKILKTSLDLDFSAGDNSLSWYIDTRKYGAVPHGGFGIGFDRLLQCLLGISNIRDIIPFPRRKNDCKC